MNTAVVEYGRVLCARWRWIMWGVVLALAATTLFLIVRPPMYRSQATVFVRTPGDVSQVLDGGDSYAQGRARTYAALASSTSVAARVIADLGLDLQPETVSQRIMGTNPRGTALIDIAVSAPSAKEAQRTATVLLSEFAATVRTLESVPGSLVPRAELVVVDPPGRPVRVVAWGASIPIVLLCAALIGLVLGAAGAVLRSIFERSVRDPEHALRIAEPPVHHDVSAEPNRQVTVDDHTTRHRSDLHIDATPNGSGTVRRHGGPWRLLRRSQNRQT
jgi:capsular polysaccharide biosynthesis protein